MTNDRQKAEDLRNAGRNEMTDARFGEDIAGEASSVVQEDPVNRSLQM